jgi:GrpB-like predicted nucleotidyltransferase (UPF0157 family)
MAKQLLNLIGIQSFYKSSTINEQILKFYESFFTRIREISGTKRITRIIRYNSVDSSGNEYVFIGLEVAEIIQIPDGMISWSIDNKIWKINENGVFHEYAIDLQWIQNVPDKANAIFDFSIKNNLSSSKNSFQDFILTANNYICKDIIVEDNDQPNLVEYDISWPEQFAQFSIWLRNHLQLPSTSRLEHYGSTAVPGMVAKPVIDILLEVPSFTDARYIINELNEPTWEYWWYEDHMMFIKRDKFMGKRSFHLHVAPKDHKIWDCLLFRDYLRTHNSAAIEYSNLKKHIVKLHKTDRERYTLAKSDFITSIVIKARSQSIKKT